MLKYFKQSAAWFFNNNKMIWNNKLNQIKLTVRGELLKPEESHLSP